MRTIKENHELWDVLTSVAYTLFLIIVTTSCSYVTVSKTTSFPSFKVVQTGKVTSASVFFERLFEGGDGLLGFNQETAHTHSMQLSTEMAFSGRQSLRVELRESDNMVSGGTRSELNLGEARAREQWYSLAMFFPAEFNGPDSEPEVITQWHVVPDPNESWVSPAKALEIRKGRLKMKIGYNTKSISLPSAPFEGEQLIDLGPVPTNSWQQFTFHMVHSHNSDGLVEIWQNGKKVLEHKGPNSHNNIALPYWKVGVYKWAWNGTNKSDVSKRVVFYDDIRQGTPSAKPSTTMSENLLN